MQLMSMACLIVDAMWFLPSALNVKVMKSERAQMNGKSNYDFQRDPHCIYLRRNETTAETWMHYRMQTL